jgi:uncharacterized protein (TIGR02145 family)
MLKKYGLEICHFIGGNMLKMVIVVLGASILFLSMFGCRSEKDQEKAIIQKTATGENQVQGVIIPKKSMVVVADTSGHGEPLPILLCQEDTLRSLNMISSDSLPKLLPSIQDLTFCIHLSLRGLALTEVPPQIGALVQLKSLDLSYNKLKTIPVEILNLKHLSYLNLSGNQITNLPKEFLQFGNLQFSEIDLSYNRLEEDRLSPELIQWLDKSDPDWRCTQKTEYVRYWESEQKNFKESTILLGLDSLPLYFFADEGPPAGLYFGLHWNDSIISVDTVHVVETKDNMVIQCVNQAMHIVNINDSKSGFLILFRGIPGMKMGPVKTWYLNKMWASGTFNDWHAPNDQNSTNEEYYEEGIRKVNLDLEGIGKMNFYGEYLKNCEEHTPLFQRRVRFANDKWRRLPALAAHEGVPTDNKYFLWIGDLDGDNLPDLILNPTVDDYDIKYLELFLSTQYQLGRIWEPAARYSYIYPGTSESTGCPNFEVAPRTWSWCDMNQCDMNNYGTFTDSRDGKTYKWSKIGEQVWMSENLNFGVVIAGHDHQTNASATSTGKYCQNDNEKSCDIYGGLYQWHSVMALPFSCNSTNTGTATCAVNTPHHQGICPQGWHVPTRDEWQILRAWVDNDNGDSYEDEGISLKSTNWWSFEDHGTDAYGWGGLPGGSHHYPDGGPPGGHWWSASQSNATAAWSRSLNSGRALLEQTINKSDYGFSLRCVRD